MTLLAIDPGSERSAWLELEAPDRVGFFDISDNDWLLEHIRIRATRYDVVVIEKVASFGMAVGAEVFETVYWSGRFAEAAHPTRVERVFRKTIAAHICGTVRAKDGNIRQALLDRFGGRQAKGTKKAPGPLYGIAADMYSALAIAVTYADGVR